MAQPQTTPVARSAALEESQSRILIGLIALSVMTGMAHHMFGVALPTIRGYFAMDADTAAWAVMAYTLPFIALMPLYGRLGDGLGKRRLLLVGTAIFLVGIAVVMSAATLPMLILGQAIQGAGTAGFVPLSIAIISERFPVADRGRVMGAWNSAVPLTGLSMPYVAGLLVDRWGWSAIFPPLLGVGVIALWLIWRYLPARTSGFQYGFLRRFDWTGVVLLSAGLMTLLFYTSSRPITGVPALRDVRLLAACVGLLGALVAWELRRRHPYVNLRLFANRTFSLTSIVAGLRMFLMSGISFLTPLYLTDIHTASASTVGAVLAVQAGTLFLVSRAGGQIADRWGSRLPTVASMLGLVGVMVGMALLPANAPLWVIFVAVALHGLIIGLSLAPLHRSAMQGIVESETGMAAGLYSMLRFAGQILGTALAGVLLQQGLDRLLPPISAYQNVFWLHVAVALIGTVASLGIREGQVSQERVR